MEEKFTVFNEVSCMMSLGTIYTLHNLISTFINLHILISINNMIHCLTRRLSHKSALLLIWKTKQYELCLLICIRIQCNFFLLLLRHQYNSHLLGPLWAKLFVEDKKYITLFYVDEVALSYISSVKHGFLSFSIYLVYNTNTRMMKIF